MFRAKGVFCVLLFMPMARVGVIAFWGSTVGILEVREELNIGVIVRSM